MKDEPNTVLRTYRMRTRTVKKLDKLRADGSPSHAKMIDTALTAFFKWKWPTDLDK